MPNAPPSKTERAFCSNCGFPVRGSRCEACGSAQEAPGARDPGEDATTKEAQSRPYAADLDVDLSGMERAVDAYRNKDTTRFIEHAIVAEGMGSARTAHSSDGSAWILTMRGSVLFVTLRAAQDELTIEIPFARLPAPKRLPALRLALELSGRDAGPARVCLRGETLICRFTARASLVTPALLRHELRELGQLAQRYAGLFAASLDAPPAIHDEQRSSAGFELLGRPRRVQVGSGGSIRRSIPPAPAAPPVPPMPPVPRIPAAAAPRAPRREEEAPDSGNDPIPAILSPAFSGGAAIAPPPPGVPMAPASDERNKRFSTAQMATAPDPRRSVSLHDVPAAAPPRQTASRHAAPEVELDAASRKLDPASAPASSAPSISPSDRLCMLLRQAQSLASLTLEERPASMSWLVRSTVFRAVYDFKDTVPDAVAHLYRCTGVGKDSPQPRGSSGQMPAVEPALIVMERVVVARAQMPKEKALALEPMVTAAQAKEHVARYLTEIDRAPHDAPLRHFLALGALTELLVRTKLPPQTDQRLRDIVAHAQREGAKLAAVDLMMTALQRINS